LPPLLSEDELRLLAKGMGDAMDKLAKVGSGDEQGDDEEVGGGCPNVESKFEREDSMGGKKV